MTKPHNNNGFNAMLTTSKGTRLAMYARAMGLVVLAEYSNYIEVDINTTDPQLGERNAVFLCFDHKDVRTGYDINN